MRAYISDGQAHGCIVRTQQNTVSSAFTELLILGRTDPATDSKLLFNYTTTQISSCGMCEEIFLDMESDCKQVCGRCDQVHELLSSVSEGQERCESENILEPYPDIYDAQKPTHCGHDRGNS